MKYPPDVPNHHPLDVNLAETPEPLIYGGNTAHSPPVSELREDRGGLLSYHLDRAIDFMQSHLGENLPVEKIAHELGMSKFYFSRLFRQKTGITPHQYLLKLRIERAKYLLKSTRLTVNEIADECGFANPSHLARHLRRDTGLSPKQFRIL